MEENVLAQPRPLSNKPGRLHRPSRLYMWVTWTIMVGAFLFALDTTIVNIAIPMMEGYVAQ